MDKFLKDLHINYKNIEYYNTAFTHSSYANENACVDYQRLEFLGDAVFDLVVSEYFYSKYDYNEGEMSKLRAMYVCEKALSFYAQTLDFHKQILLGNCEKNRVKDAIVADVFEALIAAIYLDLGYEAVTKFFNKFILPLIESNNFINDDYKSKLQELVQSDKKTLKYIVTKQEGPSHDPKFYVNVYMDEILLGSGEGSSKKIAEQNAAKCALNKMVTGD